MRNVDPTLPRDGTDLIATAVVMRIVDPTLPRVGTDLIAYESCDAQRGPDATALRY